MHFSVAEVGTSNTARSFCWLHHFKLVRPLDLYEAKDLQQATSKSLRTTDTSSLYTVASSCLTQ